MEVLLEEKIFWNVKLCATSSLKWLNEMQYHVLTVTKICSLWNQPYSKHEVNVDVLSQIFVKILTSDFSLFDRIHPKMH